jgi:hypothetical protein
VLFQNAEHDPGISHARDFNVVKIVFDVETLLERPLERFHACATGINQRTVDIEKEQSLGCHNPD